MIPEFYIFGNDTRVLYYGNDTIIYLGIIAEFHIFGNDTGVPYIWE